MVKIKICGITNEEDAITASDCGADALGFIFAHSPRKISPNAAKKIIESLPPFVVRVGVFVNEKLDIVNKISKYCKLDAVQLHGDESPSYCAKVHARVIKAFRINGKNSLKNISKYKNCAVLLDSFSFDKYGGTGKTFDWELALQAKKIGMPLILSGGLTLKNISAAIKKVKPYAIDLCSGLEEYPGKKNIKKIERAIAIASAGCIITAKR